MLRCFSSIQFFNTEYFPYLQHHLSSFNHHPEDIALHSFFHL